MGALRVGLLLLALGVSVGGCAAAPGARTPRGDGPDGVAVIVIVPVPERLPFDPRGARLTAATAELTRLAGHPIAFEIDGSLAAEWQSSFERQLTLAVETVAKDLARLKEQAPAAFEVEAPQLRRIVCRYKATAARPEVTFDTAGAIVFQEDARHGDLVAHGYVYRELEDAYAERAQARYGDMAPDDVPTQERRAYLRFLLAGRGSSRSDATPLRDATSLTITRLVRLATLMRPSEPKLVEDEIDRYLLTARDHFVDGYQHHRDEAQGHAPAFHAAERAWAEWLGARFGALKPEDQQQIAAALFTRDRDGFIPFAFPGTDKMGFALAIVDRWIAAGRPDTTTARTPDGALYEYILCPSPKAPDGGRPRGPRCEYALYRMAAENDVARKRLTEFLLARKNPELAEIVFVATARVDTSARPLAGFFALLRATEGDVALWTVGIDVLSEHADTGGQLVKDEVRRLWAAYPARRGALLRVLGELDPYGHDHALWDEFAGDFGAKITRADVGGMLSAHPAAIVHLPKMWPALAPGWSRADVIVAHLDAWLDAGAPRNPQSPWSVVRDFIHLLCDDGPPELAKLRAHMAQRTRTRPGDPFVGLAEEAAPAHCHPSTRPHAPAPPSARVRRRPADPFQ